MNNIILMYHYIRDNSKYNAFTTNQFRNQLKFVADNGYKFITVEELITKRPSEKTCCITFDDGIKDGITTAFPILQEFNATATFFIPMKIFIVNEILTIQKRYLLLAQLGENRFIRIFNELSNDEYTISSSNFKYTLDHMDDGVCDFIINNIFNDYFNEQDEFNNIYLNRYDIEQLMLQGMEIGTHGFNHHYLGDKCHKDIKSDIQLSYGICKAMFKAPTSISYPYGNYNSLVETIAKTVGYKVGISTIKKRNTTNDLQQFTLNRYDCIDTDIMKDD